MTKGLNLWCHSVGDRLLLMPEIVNPLLLQIGLHAWLGFAINHVDLGHGVSLP